MEGFPQYPIANARPVRLRTGFWGSEHITAPGGEPNNATQIYLTSAVVQDTGIPSPVVGFEVVDPKSCPAAVGASSSQSLSRKRDFAQFGQLDNIEETPSFVQGSELLPRIEDLQLSLPHRPVVLGASRPIPLRALLPSAPNRQHWNASMDSQPLPITQLQSHSQTHRQLLHEQHQHLTLQQHHLQQQQQDQPPPRPPPPPQQQQPLVGDFVGVLQQQHQHAPQRLQGTYATYPPFPLPHAGPSDVGTGAGVGLGVAVGVGKPRGSTPPGLGALHPLLHHQHDRALSDVMPLHRSPAAKLEPGSAPSHSTSGVPGLERQHYHQQECQQMQAQAAGSSQPWRLTSHQQPQQRQPMATPHNLLYNQTPSACLHHQQQQQQYQEQQHLPLGDSDDDMSEPVVRLPCGHINDWEGTTQLLAPPPPLLSPNQHQHHPHAHPHQPPQQRMHCPSSHQPQPPCSLPTSGHGDHMLLPPSGCSVPGWELPLDLQQAVCEDLGPGTSSGRSLDILARGRGSEGPWSTGTGTGRGLGLGLGSGPGSQPVRTWSQLTVRHAAPVADIGSQSVSASIGRQGQGQLQGAGHWQEAVAAGPGSGLEKPMPVGRQHQGGSDPVVRRLGTGWAGGGGRELCPLSPSPAVPGVAAGDGGQMAAQQQQQQQQQYRHHHQQQQQVAMIGTHAHAVSVSGYARSRSNSGLWAEGLLHGDLPPSCNLSRSGSLVASNPLMRVVSGGQAACGQGPADGQEELGPDSGTLEEAAAAFLDVTEAGRPPPSPMHTGSSLMPSVSTLAGVSLGVSMGAEATGYGLDVVQPAPCGVVGAKEAPQCTSGTYQRSLGVEVDWAAGHRRSARLAGRAGAQGADSSAAQADYGDCCVKGEEAVASEGSSQPYLTSPAARLAAARAARQAAAAAAAEEAAAAAAAAASAAPEAALGCAGLTRSGRPRLRHRMPTTFGDLVRLGLVGTGPQAFIIGNTDTVDVNVQQDGTMLCGLGEFRSVSALALTVLRQRNPQRRACDGWKEVRVPAAHGGQAGQGQGQGVRLDQLRLRALAMQAAEDVEAGAGAERQSGRGTGSRAGLRPVLEEQGSGEEEGGG